MIDATKPQEKQKNEHDVRQGQIESDKQTCQKKSTMPKFSSRSKFNALEILGTIFLFIIIYIACCEMIRYGSIKLLNLPKDAVLYRYQWIYCVITLFLGSTGTMLIAFAIGILFFSAIENIMLVCVEYLYVDGKRFYKWWQTKLGIYFIIQLIVAIIWTIFVIESCHFMLSGFDLITIRQDRLIVYRISYLFILMTCSVFVFGPIMETFDSIVKPFFKAK